MKSWRSHQSNHRNRGHDGPVSDSPNAESIRIDRSSRSAQAGGLGGRHPCARNGMRAGTVRTMPPDEDHPRRRRTLPPTVVAIVGCGVVVGGCGGQSHTPSSVSTTTTVATTPRVGGLEGLPAKQVLARARRATKGMRSVRFTRSPAREETSTRSDMVLTRTGRSSWRALVGAVSVDYVTDGTTTVVRGNREYFRTKLPPGLPVGQADRLAGKWWRFKAGSISAHKAMRAMAMTVKVDYVLSATALSTAPGVVVGGVPAVGLRVHLPGSSAPVTMYVADDGSDRLIALATGGEAPLWDEFSEWGTATPLEGPPSLTRVPELPAWASQPSQRRIPDTPTQTA